MLLDMALGSKAPASFRNRCRMTAALLLVLCVTLTKSAPTTYDEIEAKRTDLVDYFNNPNGCYHNYLHYEEGDRIMTNEPCLNCTCHNRMLMCYLRVCPFSKAIGQDCTVKKSPDQCCPVISCPEVPVHLLTSTTTQKPTTTTEIGWHDNYGCMMNEDGFFPDGAQVPSNPKKPCELCYCIRNRTACVMQECTLHVEGCRPVYQDGVCCPVRYDCDYESEKPTTSAPQITGGLVFSTTNAPFDCRINDEMYNDGESISMDSDKPCNHCYCMRGDIVCAVQDCGEPLRGKDCTPDPPRAGQCCPTSYQCANETINSDDITTLQPVLQSDSDENEAEKFNSNNDVYDKLGENQPSHDDDTNELNIEHIFTTVAYNNGIPPDGTSDQTTHDSVIDSHNAVGDANIVPASDSENKINEEKQQENPNTTQDLTNQVNPTATETDQNNYESTGKPVEPISVNDVQTTQSPAADILLNSDGPTTQTILNENTNGNINEEGDSENASQLPSQDDLASNLPNVSTESSTEIETQNNNHQDKPQEDIQQQTDTPLVVEKEPTISSNDQQNTPEVEANIKPQTETPYNENQNPPKQSSDDSTESYTGGDNVQTTSVSLNEYEQATQKIDQNDIGNIPLEESNPLSDSMSNNKQSTPDQGIQDVTQTPQQTNSQTEDLLNVGQNVLNDNKPQEENVPPTETLNEDNQTTEQNEPLTENNKQVDNQPESENSSTEQNQDVTQGGNASPNDPPKVENESSQQNEIPTDNKPQADNQLESESTSTEQNQDNLQSENVSPTVQNQVGPQEKIPSTELPTVENEPTEQNKLPVENQPQVDIKPDSDNPSTEQNQDVSQGENVSPTEPTKVDYEPTEQNHDGSQGENVSPTEPPKVDNEPTEQNQDGSQDENISPTEPTKIDYEPTEQNQDSSQGENVSPTEPPKVENGPIEQNQDGSQGENVSPTEPTKVDNEPTEHNQDGSQGENVSPTEPTKVDYEPTEQNQDGSQGENVSPTEPTKVDNDPTEQNQDAPQGENVSPTEPTEQNQDSSQGENVSPTEPPKVENGPIEQNHDSSQGENVSPTEPPNVENGPIEQNQDSSQGENVSPTEPPKVENGPIEQTQDNSQGENVSPTEPPPKAENEPIEQNQDVSQGENVSPTEPPKVENGPIEQTQDSSQGENISPTEPAKVENGPIEQNQDSSQGENISPTEPPKVENEPTEQNQDSSQGENVSPTEPPKVENGPIEQTQDSSQGEYVSPTEPPPKAENEPIEQNQDGSQSENVSPTEPTKVNYEPTEQNQDSSQGENVSPTEPPKVVNEPTEQNQDGSQGENISPTEPSKVENDQTEQNKLPVENQAHDANQPELDNPSTEQNQGSPQEKIPSTELPTVENEPTEQNKLPVENQPQVDIKPDSDNPSTEQNQDVSQGENVSPTEPTKVDNEPSQQNEIPTENKPQADNQHEIESTSTEQNQDSPQENILSTELPTTENEPTEQNILPVENQPQIDLNHESGSPPTEQNQDSPQENIPSTEPPKVENEPTEQNQLAIENKPQIDNVPESINAPVEQNNQDSPQTENVSPTEIPTLVNEPVLQNKPQVENNPQTENQPESENIPIKPNQDSQQSENVTPTELPKVDNEQNKPLVENDPHAENQPESQKPSIGENQNIPLVNDVSPTEIPSKLNDPQSENVPIKPSVSENDVSTEQPEEDNSIFVVSPTSPPLFSQNQVKGEESTSTLNVNDSNDKYSSTEKNENIIIEAPQPSAEDKISSSGDSNNLPALSSTETATESNNVSPQVNDQNTDQSTGTKPIENEVNNDVTNGVTSSPVSSNDQTPVSGNHNDNQFDQNKPAISEPALIPTTESNDVANSGITNQSVLTDDPTSQENQPDSIDEVNKEHDSIEHQNGPETVTTVELESFTKAPSVYEPVNDFTTPLPQQQLTNNNIQLKPEEINPVEPTQTHDESKTPNNMSENSSPEISPDNHNVPTVISEIQDIDTIPEPTKAPVFDTINGEQFVPTQIPEQTNEYENSTPHHEQSEDENNNEIVDQTSINPEPSSDNNHNLDIATGPNLNNEEFVTPLSDKIEPGTNVQESSEEPTQNTNENGSVENESTTNSQAGQIVQETSEKVDNIENIVTTNSYADVSSVVPTTYSPVNQDNENKGSSPINPSNNLEINGDNYQPATVIPQQNVDSGETSTQYSVDYSTTSNIQEPQSVNVNNPPNVINQNQISEIELFTTQSPTEKNTFTADSNKTPISDATPTDIPNSPEQNNNSEINANEIVDEQSTESPQDTDKPLVTNAPDYVIDITTIGSNESPNNVFEPIKTEDQENFVNEVTTSNVDQNTDVTTELYENAQPGVPGEGSCLINFITYAHKAEVPKSNPCHEKCECLNSIITCTSVNCPPAPPQHKNCIPLHPGNESWCCPTYLCEGGIEGMIFENNNNGGAPQLISSVLLEDKPGEENDDKTPTDEIPSTSSPQIALEYNTVTPSQSDLNSNINPQNAISVTEIPVQNENPDKLTDDFIATTDNENFIPVTTANIESTDHEKPIENENPVISDQLSENEKPTENEKPAENEQLSENDKPAENEKPAENDQLSENEKPAENDQSSTNEKPSDNSEVEITTVPYVSNEQTATNKPETSYVEQTTLSNTVSESQDTSAPSTDKPSYESTIANILPVSDQNQLEQNAELDDSITGTTYKPKDTVVDQQVNEQLKDDEGVSKPTFNEESNVKPIVYTTDLPAVDVNPVEITQTPVIVADEKPTINENNVNSLRPTSIDDIISSVNMVKDAIKNSLETSSKPAEIDYQTTGAIENDQPTVVTGESDGSVLENSSPSTYNEPQTTVNSVNSAPELQTVESNEKLPENLTPIESSDESGGTVQNPHVTLSTNADQTVSTDSPLNVPDKQESSSGPSATNSDANKPEEIVDDKTPEVTTARYPVSSTDQDSAIGGPETPSDVNIPQVNAEPSTNVPPGLVADDRISEITTQALPSAAQQEVHADGSSVNKPPPEGEKPANAAAPDSSNADGGADNVQPAEPVTQTVNSSQPSTENSAADNDGSDDQSVGGPNSSPAPSEPPVMQDVNKRPQDGTGDTVQIPFDTEKPSSRPSSSTPYTPVYSQKPSYTPIPQSTWTPKPFHQDSTSEAPQPDQGFPDEYDDENEAVFGPGTCRYGGKIYVSAQQVPRDDPCDFCFCFRGDIICLQQSCPPPIFGCYQENIQGFCCPRYECPVAQATSVNVTTTTTTTTTAVPPHFFAGAYRGAAKRTGCLIHGHSYRVGEDVGIASGPCLECTCRADGKMKCDPKPCSPEPLLRKMMAEAVDQRKR